MACELGSRSGSLKELLLGFRSVSLSEYGLETLSEYLCGLEC